MQIELIELKNFKSYKELKISLTQFNVLIGANAAGKSNCINTLSFFKNVVKDGLENAISMQGGIKFLRNINSSSKETDVFFRLVFKPDKDFKFFGKKGRTQYEFLIKKFDYRFLLKLDIKKDDYKIVDDSLKQTYDLYKVKKSGNELITSANFTISKNSDKFKFNFTKHKLIPFQTSELKKLLFIGFEDFTIEKRLLKTSRLKKTLLFETPLYFMPHVETLKRDFAKISIYDFNPRYPKQSTSIAGKAELMENGENLALVLRKILADKDNKRTFLNLIKFLLPFVEDLSVENLMDKYLQIVINEKYSPEKQIPGFLLSDGTIFAIGIVTALYFEDKPIVVFEEPERRIHPSLISKIIDLMKDASVDKQIILSTHNPEIVKYAGIKNIHFVTRDDEGYSEVLRIEEKNEISTFLENEIGIEELYIQNLLN